MVNKLFSFKIVRYGLIGGLSTLIHMSVAFLYLYYVSKALFVANIVGFFTAYLFSYVVQSRFVFSHALSWKKALKYFSVQFSSLLMALFISEQVDFVNTYVQTVIVVLVIPLITYVIHKMWTFKNL